MNKYILGIGLLAVPFATSEPDYSGGENEVEFDFSVPPSAHVTVAVEANSFDNLDGFELNKDDYGTLKVYYDTTGDIQITTKIDLANSSIIDDSVTAFNKLPLMWSIQPQSNIHDDNLDIPSRVIKMDLEDPGTSLAVDTGQGYNGHEIYLLNSRLLNSKLDNISLANMIHKKTSDPYVVDDHMLLAADRYVKADGTDVLNNVADPGNKLDTNALFDTAQTNPEITDEVKKASNGCLEYKIGFHRMLGMVATTADQVYKIQFETTIVDITQAENNGS